MANVVLAIPSYSGTVHLGTFRSLLGDVLALRDRGDRVAIYDEAGGAEIDTARAQIVAEFMDSDGEILVMIDSDVCWSRGGLLRLIDSKKLVISGCYPHRKDPITWPIQTLNDSIDAVDGVAEVKAVPGGFLCIRREALQRMIDAHPELEFQSSKTEARCWALFDHVWEGKTRLSEDLSFCARWRALGGQIYIDQTITMGHVGPKLFTGKI